MNQQYRSNMATKYKIIAKGKNKTQRKWKTRSSRIPRATTVRTYDIPLDQLEFLKEAERTGKLTDITWIITNDGPIDEKIKQILHYLHSEKAKEMNYNIKKRYDYAWIKLILDRGKIPSSFLSLRSMSTPKFVTYILSLGFYDIAGSKTLNKELATAFWDSLNNKIIFRNVYVDIKECRRRNSIALKFFEMLNEI